MTVQEILVRYDIPKHTLASVAGVTPQDVSTYLRRGPISGRRIVQIEQAASDLKMVYDRLELMGRMTNIYLTIRTKDTNSILAFIDWCKKNPAEVPAEVQQET